MASLQDKPTAPRTWPEGEALLAALSPAMVDLMDELSSTMFCSKDVTGRYVLVNRVFVARTNERSRRAVVGRRATDLFVPQLAERYDQQDAEVLRTGRPLRNELELIRRLGGTPGWFLTSKLPVHDGAGHLVGLVSVSQDLREDDADDASMDSMARLVAGRGREDLVFGDGKSHVRRPKNPRRAGSTVPLLAPRLSPTRLFAMRWQAAGNRYRHFRE